MISFFLWILNQIKLIKKIKLKYYVGLNGASCTVDTDCLYGAETSTSYVNCSSSLCSCRPGFTWNSTYLTCQCLANKNVTGTGASAQCRKFLFVWNYGGGGTFCI